MRWLSSQQHYPVANGRRDSSANDMTAAHRNVRAIVNSGVAVRSAPQARIPCLP
jgi:hypothetical protein